MLESLNKELRFGTEKHEEIVRACVARKRYSSDKMADSRERWRKADENMVAYVPQKEADRLRQSRRDSKGEMDFITLEVPYYFATVSAMHTYLTSVFLSRTPIYQVSARHGEGQDAVTAIESVMDYQLRTGMHLPVHYNWLWDGCKYSAGIVGEYWDQEIVTVSQIVEEAQSFLGISLGKTKKVKKTYEVPGFEGNRLYNIRPYDFYPDPRLPLYQFQDGEFCGREISMGYSAIERQQTQGRYFNVDVLRKTKGKKAAILEAKSGYSSGLSNELTEGSPVIDTPYGRGGYGDWSDGEEGQEFVTVLEMCISISPRDWGLGESTKHEKWVFTIVNEALLIGARPLGLFHNRFPYSVLETGFGSEEFIKSSTIDNIRPLGQTLSWLFNTHMYNVRKAINDVRVVDPSKVVMKDLARPEPGGVIRLKPSYFGGDVRSAIMQLPATDVTINHLRDSKVVEELIQRVSGVTDNIMGLMQEGGRKTATEVRTASGFSVNRMKTLGEYFSACGYAPLLARLISNTQQLMTTERKFAIAGGNGSQAESFMQVNPEAIAGFYDYVAVDGTLPIDRLAQANFWKELLTQMARAPQLAGQWDLGAMLAHTMELQGERNVNRFKIQVAPPGMAPGGMVPGNVIPIGGAGGQTGRTSGGGSGGVGPPPQLA